MLPWAAASSPGRLRRAGPPTAKPSPGSSSPPAAGHGAFVPERLVQENELRNGNAGTPEVGDNAIGTAEKRGLGKGFAFLCHSS